MATTAAPALLTLSAFTEAQARIRGVAVHTPLVRLTIPGFDARRSLRQGRRPAAHRQLQNPRRLQQDRPAHPRPALPRRHHLLQRQPRSGSRLRRPCRRRQSRHRHALERTRDQEARHRRPRRRDRRSRPRQLRPPTQSRRTPGRARLHHDPALRRRPDHRRPGHLRPRNPRRPARRRPRPLPRLRRRTPQRHRHRHQALQPPHPGSGPRHRCRT